MYVYEEGITTEINEVFLQLRVKNKIKRFTLLFDTDNHHYRVIAILEECTLAQTRSIFLSFLQFISYSEAIIFAQKQTEMSIHYEYASFNTTGRGICCEIDFITEATQIQREEFQRDHEKSYPVLSTMHFDSHQQPHLLWQYEVNDAGSWPPIVVQDIVFTVSETGNIYAIDAEQGSLKWHWEPHPDQQLFRILSHPKVDNGTLYIPVQSFLHGKHTAFLYAINTRTGQLLKKFPLSLFHHAENSRFFTTHDGVGYLSVADSDTTISSSPGHGVHTVCQAINLQTEASKWGFGYGRRYRCHCSNTCSREDVSCSTDLVS